MHTKTVKKVSCLKWDLELATKIEKKLEHIKHRKKERMWMYKAEERYVNDSA